MRNDFTAATEISDSELENISGGLVAGGANTGAEIAGHGVSANVGGFLGAGASVSPEGASAQVAGSVMGAVHATSL
ncbi:bacteriocin [Streptomyces sp. NPDC047049]|uniref:bacteriocin n=1 Tax=Streptomyces sp. NPDC047049 TaxID=3156688 RepID=UPI0033E2558E